MLEISINQAKPELAKFLHHIDKGEDVLISNDKGQSYFIVPVFVTPTKNKPKFACARGKIEISDDFDEPLAEMADYMPSDLQLVK